MKNLLVKREQIASALQRFQSYLDSLIGKENIDTSNLEERLPNIRDLLNEFKKIQSEIELHDESELTKAETRINFETLYYSAVSTAKQLISSNSIQAIRNLVRQNALKPQIRLPKIDLPKFNGSYDQWFPFFDTFNSLINSNKEITEIEKFHYLKSTLQGDAKCFLYSLEISAENYNVAWDTLKCCYDNKRIIAKNHIRDSFFCQMSFLSAGTFALQMRCLFTITRTTTNKGSKITQTL